MLRSCAQRTKTLAPGLLPLLALGGCRTAKQTTGIVGLEVEPEARSLLRQTSEQILQAVKVIPESAEYRRNVESTVRFRIKAVDSEEPDEALEQQFGLQLEELIMQNRDELELIPMMAEWKPWEVPEGHQIEGIIEEPVPTEERVVKEPVKPA